MAFSDEKTLPVGPMKKKKLTCMVFRLEVYQSVVT
jgi:hypothetical protein